jgi:hypothetical protein
MAILRKHMNQTLVFALVMFSLTNALGQVIEDTSYRTWQDRSGKFDVEARLVEINGKEVTIERKDTKARITLKIERLSGKDQGYVSGKKNQANVKAAFEKEASSIELIREKVDEVIEQLSVQVPGETSVQKEDRRNATIRAFQKEIKGLKFTLFIIVDDIRTIRLTSQVEDFLSLNSGPKIGSEISVVPKVHAFAMPTKFVVRLRDELKSVKKGDYAAIRCQLGDNTQRIGEFQCKYQGWELGTSILEVKVLDKTLVEHIFSAMQDPNKRNEPQHIVANMPRSEFHSAFSAFSGSNSTNRLCIVDREEMYSIFGPPSSARSVQLHELLDYQCHDGVVRITIRTGVDAVLTDGQVMIESVDDL